jgi:hypothetical protein
MLIRTSIFAIFNYIIINMFKQSEVFYSWWSLSLKDPEIQADYKLH